MNREPIKKEQGEKAPNRLLDLSELESPFFRRILEKMDRLLEEESGLYLHPSKRWEYPWALEQADLPPGSRVLDAGCGASVFPLYLASEGHRVSALDYVPPPRPCREGMRIDFLRSDLGALPFSAESFETIFCISVLEHLCAEGMERSLRELRRVLVPGGKLLVTTDFAEDAGVPMRYEGPGDSFPVDWNVFDEDLLRKRLLHAPGFRVEGRIDLTTDWASTRAALRNFHGYPYTSVGVALTRT